MTGLRRSTRDVVEELASGGLTDAIDGVEEDRIRRITDEVSHAFRAMGPVRRGVAIFGSAREPPVGEWGAVAREVARALAAAGFSPITGGGPGLMAAANEGAFDAGGPSVGLTIRLPDEEPANDHLTLEVPFHYFFVRKLAFVKYSCAFVLLPGGFGTLDELFEALNLRRTHRLHPFPVILVGSSFWGGLVDWLRTDAVGGGTLSDEDLEMLTITDDPEHVVAEVVECHRTLCRRLGIDG